MYYEAVKTKTYYRSYKGVKKPVNQINLGINSEFKDGDDGIVISKDDLNKLLDVSDKVDMDEINKIKDENEELKDKLSKYDDIAERVELLDKLNNLHEEYKDELSDVNSKLYLETQKKEDYQNVINDLLSRGLISRILNTKPQSYYLTGNNDADIIDVNSNK